MKIKVCIPFYSEFETCKLGLQELESCKEHEFVIAGGQGALIGKTRNSLINDGKSDQKFQKPSKEFDAFLTLDSDISFTLDNVLKLIAHDKDIVCSPYLRHGYKTDYVCGWFSDVVGSIGKRGLTSHKGLLEIHWSGSGMNLIKAHVYEKMEFPWYRHTLVKSGTAQSETGEDIGFCVGAKSVGFKVWCDFDNPVKHRDRDPNNFNWDIHNIANVTRNSPTESMVSLESDEWTVLGDALMDYPLPFRKSSVLIAKLRHQLNLNSINENNIHRK